MRNLLITLAATASALVVATPASAQYFPQPQPQGYGYGYQNAYGQVRSLQVRVDRLQGLLDSLASRRLISRNEYNELHRDSHGIELRLRQTARYGLNPRERYDIERRIAGLEHRIDHEVRDGRRGHRGYGNDYHGSGYGVAYYDRDRDGRDDRYEDDRGYDHD